MKKVSNKTAFLSSTSLYKDANDEDQNNWKFLMYFADNGNIMNKKKAWITD